MPAFLVTSGTAPPCQAVLALSGARGLPHPCPQASTSWGPTPHLIVFLQHHSMGKALVQAQNCELPAGAPDIQNQVRAGHVAQDVQEDLIREAEKVGAHRDGGCRRGHVALIGRVL